ncbi:MAG: L,D-transpeptidase [Bacteroidales bacterium]|nr:L,D-transpeptidase [Bacteroidales bacterium]
MNRKMIIEYYHNGYSILVPFFRKAGQAFNRFIIRMGGAISRYFHLIRRYSAHLRSAGIAAGITAGICFLWFFVIPHVMQWSAANVLAGDEMAPSAYKGKIGFMDPEKESDRLRKKLAGMTPNEAYLVVNTSANTFRLYKRRKLIREGVCSTGSYILLEAHDERKWIFSTPTGIRRIRGKTQSPVWRKPDWAFVEEGLPVPPPGAPDRFEYGVLGDYALSLGDGYLIHGTLYKRFLGLPVTHGCIRMGDEDLEAVYKNLQVGSRVFIY